MKRQQSKPHLDFIRGLPCVICLDNTTTEAAHIRFADRRAAKRETGMGEKPDDIWTVPLCGKHHRRQHEVNERYFWTVNGIDPVFTALALCRVVGDQEAAEEICRSARR